MNLYIIVLGTCPSKTQRTPLLCVVRASPPIPITEGWYLFYLRVCVHCKKIYCGQLDYPPTGSSKCPDILSSFSVCTFVCFLVIQTCFCNSLLLSKALQLSQPLQTSTTLCALQERESVCKWGTRTIKKLWPNLSTKKKHNVSISSPSFLD